MGGGFAFDVEVGIPGLSIGAEAGVSAGGGGFALDIISEAQEERGRQDARFRDNIYRMYFAYAELEVGVGTSVAGKVSISGGTPSMHTDGGYVRRIGPLAPDASGELGDPTGFLGMAATISVNKTHDAGMAVSAGYIVCGPPHGVIENIVAGASILLQFKYGAPFWGVSLSTTIGAGAAVQTGLILGIQNLRTGRWVRRGANTFL